MPPSPPKSGLISESLSPAQMKSSKKYAKRYLEHYPLNCGRFEKTWKTLWGWATFSISQFHVVFVMTRIVKVLAQTLTTGFWGKEAWRPTPKWNTSFFFHFPHELRISFKPKVAIAKFFGKMQKSLVLLKSGLDAMPLFLLDGLLRDIWNLKDIWRSTGFPYYLSNIQGLPTCKYSLDKYWRIVIYIVDVNIDLELAAIQGSIIISIFFVNRVDTFFSCFNDNMIIWPTFTIQFLICH